MAIEPNSIILGDCLDVMSDIEDESIDLILADLPYGMTRNRWDSIIDLKLLWEQYRRVRKEDAAIVLTSVQPFTTLLISSNKDEFKYCWYWIKNRATGVLNAKIQPLRNVEEVCVFNVKSYNPQGLILANIPSRNSKRDYSNYGKGTNKKYVQKYTNYPKQTLMFPSVQRTIHPNQKPVELLEYLIRTYTNSGDVVLDNTAGSGSTGVACINTGRKYILIEQDEDYYDIAKKRIESCLP